MCKVVVAFEACMHEMSYLIISWIQYFVIVVGLDKTISIIMVSTKNRWCWLTPWFMAWEADVWETGYTGGKIWGPALWRASWLLLLQFSFLSMHLEKQQNMGQVLGLWHLCEKPRWSSRHLMLLDSKSVNRWSLSLSPWHSNTQIKKINLLLKYLWRVVLRVVCAS